MREIVKKYKVEDVERLNTQVEDVTRTVFGIQDTMINSKPWAAHWLGGDLKHGATEVRPERFQAALDEVTRAALALRKAGFELAMLSVESSGSGQS
jgi:hypothetical protein